MKQQSQRGWKNKCVLVWVLVTGFIRTSANSKLKWLGKHVALAVYSSFCYDLIYECKILLHSALNSRFEWRAQY